MDLIQEMLKYSNNLFKEAFSLCNDENDAKDLVQETFLSVLIIVNKGVIIENIKPYLLATLKNKYVDYYRKKCSTQYTENFNDNLYFDEPSENTTTSLKYDKLNSIRHELGFIVEEINK